jgi:chitosanase
MNDLQKATSAAIVNVFETGRVRGNYGAVAVLKGDSGHLSYGRSQTTLGSGSLFKLLTQYCDSPSAKFGADLKPFLPRFELKDFSLDTDATVRTLLQRAGKEDPAMRATQDQFFNENYLGPACRAAENLGITSALGQTVVYDSHVQGGWGKLQPRVGPLTARGEYDWVKAYVAVRKTWLQSLAPPLPSTVYRMDAFSTLIEQNKWDLPLPLAIHGVEIAEAALAGDVAAPGTTAKRTLRITTPYLRGLDVTALQQALAQNGLVNSADGVYGPFTDTLVQNWQARKAIQEDGAGPKTMQSLGL